MVRTKKVIPASGGSDVAGLMQEIASLVPSMTPSVAQIGQLLLEDPGRVAQMTVTELADATGTSESTVVRTARALGFLGYPQLRLALAGASAQHVTEGSTLAADIGRDDAPDIVIAKLAASEEDALRATVRRLDTAQLTAAVEAITAARRVDLYGVGVSGLVATDLWQKLLRIGVMCNVHVEMHQALTGAVLLGPGDVAVAVSHSGETIETLEPVRQAKRNGAVIVALTSRSRSPLARLADHTLLSAGREEPLRPGAMASRTSQLLAADCLFVGVAQRRYDTAMQALRRTSETLAAHRESGRRSRR